MNDLGPDARHLLAAAGNGDEPSVEDEARVRAKIAARIAAGAALGSAAVLSAKSAAASTGAAAGTTATTLGNVTGAAFATSMTLTAKIALGIALTVGAAGVTLTTVHLRAEANPTVPTVPAPAAAPSGVGFAPALTPAPALAPASASASASAPAPALAAAAALASAPALASVPPLARHPALPPAALGQVAASPSTSTSDPLATEALLLRSAQLALARGDTAGAMANLDEHAARFPDGALAEERAATRVRALCAQGHASEARAAAGSFVAAHPGSGLAPSIRNVCAGHDAATNPP